MVVCDWWTLSCGILQAVEQVGSLEKRLEEQKEDYELILSRWEAQREGDANLEHMLRSDLDRLSEER